MSGGTYPRELEAQGDRDPGQGAKPLHTMDQSAHNACFGTAGGNRSTLKKPPKHGENMQTSHIHRAEAGFKSGGSRQTC